MAVDGTFATLIHLAGIREFIMENYGEGSVSGRIDLATIVALATVEGDIVAELEAQKGT